MQNNFLNYKRLNVSKPFKLNFKSRIHRYYQPKKTGTLSVVTSTGAKLKISQREPLTKIARRVLKKKSILTVSSSSNFSYTSKPLGVRMGKGKGKVEGTVLLARAGQPVLTFSEVEIQKAEKLFKRLKKRSTRLKLISLNY